MLARSAAQSWLGALLIRSEVAAACSQSSSVLALKACSHDGSCFAQQQVISFHSSGSCTSQEGSSDAPDTVSSGSNTSSAASADAGVAAAAPLQQQQQQLRHKLAEVTSAGIATLQQHATTTGYRESFIPAGRPTPRPSSSSSSSSSQSSISHMQQQHSRTSPEAVLASVELPEETLRIPLRQEAKQEQKEVQVDAFSLSRSLVSEHLTAISATAAMEPQQQLTAADKEALEKLVGILTKDGKKSRARRLLLDAMHIVKQQLTKGKTAA